MKNYNVKGMVCEGVDWIQLAQERVQLRTLVKTVTNLWVL